MTALGVVALVAARDRAGRPRLAGQPAVHVAGVAHPGSRPRAPPPPSRDGRLWALERVVTGHLTSREPTSALALQLRELADQRLALRHGVHWDTDRDRTVELLGPEVVALVEARPPRRMSLGQIDAVLRRIEDV